MKIKSFGKINLTLEVGGIRSDNFHEIKSIVQTISLSDSIFIGINGSGKISLDCSEKSIPCDERNTVFKAAKLFLEEHGIDKGIEIFLEKNIPFEAGLGGGSGNAGAVLLALNKIFHTGMDEYSLSEIGSKIGSDVPLFVFGGTVFMTGRGEIITPLEDFDKLYLNVIKHKNLGVSTKSAYEILDKRDDFSFKGYSENLLKNPSSVNFTNDFHTPILDLYPELKSVQEKIVLSGAERVLLSGSGASIFGTYPSKQKRDAGFDTLSSDNNIDVFSCESMNRNEYKNFILGDLD